MTILRDGQLILLAFPLLLTLLFTLFYAIYAKVRERRSSQILAAEQLGDIIKPVGPTGPRSGSNGGVNLEDLRDTE